MDVPQTTLESALCPRCGYSLRSVTDWVCPKCARRFTPSELDKAPTVVPVNGSLCLAIAIEVVLLGVLCWIARQGGRSGDGQAAIAFLCPMAIFVLFALLIGFGGLVSRRHEDRAFRRREHAMAAWIGVVLTALFVATVVIVSIADNHAR